MRAYGADPGAKHAAIVVRDGRDLVDAVYIEREPGTSRTDWLKGCSAQANMLWLRRMGLYAGVEDVNAPNPHVGRRRRDGSDRGAKIIDPGPTIDAALCAGALWHAFHARCHAVLIPPAGFGSEQPDRRHLLALYPAELVGPRETTGAGKSKWQHLRAAWDVAGATLLHYRIGAVTQ